jgi:catechol 2,3-dioxygenase-like lactoylglutathione lyase family enzyme
MIDHFTLTVQDYDRSKAFYSRVLEPLGYRVLMSFDGMCGFGDELKPYFWIKRGDTPTQPMHIAFLARERAAVDAFHAAALAAGARDDGKPGVRAEYHPHYYGAFVIDPNGHPLEAVIHAAPKAKSKPKPKARGRARPKKPAARSKQKKRTRR